ncbi:hypothetical protein [Streptomyces sp. NPDC020667]|uniref:hypothetical protein n=2 Tax=Streptomyces TaxID=1883 RepID=UPI0033F79A69
MTHAELMTLPVSFPLETANRALGVGRTQGYFMAKAGTYPVRVRQLGRAYRVTRYDLWGYLGLPVVAPDGAANGEAMAA